MFFFFLNNKEARSIVLFFVFNSIIKNDWTLYSFEPIQLHSFHKLVAAKQACSPAPHHEQRYLLVKTNFKVRHGTCKNRTFKNQSRHRYLHCHLLCEINKAADIFYFAVASFRYAIKSALSDFFLIPAKIIFVPGMYFFGFSKYSIRVSSPQVIPLFLLASV